MPLETTSHISGLIASNPASSDGLNQADDHIRLIKSVLLNDVGSALTSQKLTVVDGAAGNPALGYSADATAGFYRKSTGVQGIIGSLVGQGATEVGSVMLFAGIAVPTGYLACDGAAVSRTTYAALYAALGGASSPWGQGDGTTTFNTPNLTGRFPRNTGGAGSTVGTLQADQNKSHTHTFSATTGTESVSHTHTFSGTTGAMSANATHQHTFTAGTAAGFAASGPFGFSQAPGASTTDFANTDHTHAYSGTTSAPSASHTHSVSGTTATGSADGTEARPLSATLLFCVRAL